MNVYDFDGTLLEGDTEDYFFAYLFRQQKGLFLYRVNYEFWELVMRLFSIPDKTRIRQNQYRVLRKIPDLDSLLQAFWEVHKKYLKAWYPPVHRPDDIVASATPAFLLEPILPELGITRLVATDMDPKTGRIRGHFTSHAYKAEAFRQRFDVGQMEAFYSDTYSDHFMADLAKEAYAVHGEVCTAWKTFFADRYPA